MPVSALLTSRSPVTAVVATIIDPPLTPSTFNLRGTVVFATCTAVAEMLILPPGPMAFCAVIAASLLNWTPPGARLDMTMFAAGLKASLADPTILVCMRTGDKLNASMINSPPAPLAAAPKFSGLVPVMVTGPP